MGQTPEAWRGWTAEVAGAEQQFPGKEKNTEGLHQGHGGWTEKGLHEKLVFPIAPPPRYILISPSCT